MSPYEWWPARANSRGGRRKQNKVVLVQLACVVRESTTPRGAGRRGQVWANKHMQTSSRSKDAAKRSRMTNGAVIYCNLLYSPPSSSLWTSIFLKAIWTSTTTFVTRSRPLMSSSIQNAALGFAHLQQQQRGYR